MRFFQIENKVLPGYEWHQLLLYSSFPKNFSTYSNSVVWWAEFKGDIIKVERLKKLSRSVLHGTNKMQYMTKQNQIPTRKD